MLRSSVTQFYDVLGYRVGGRVVGTIKRSYLEKGANLDESYDRLAEVLVPDTTPLVDTFRRAGGYKISLGKFHEGRKVSIIDS